MQYLLDFLGMYFLVFIYPVSNLKACTEFLKNLFGIIVTGEISLSLQSGHSWSSDSIRVNLIPRTQN